MAHSKCYSYGSCTVRHIRGKNLIMKVLGKGGGEEPFFKRVFPNKKHK